MWNYFKTQLLGLFVIIAILLTLLNPVSAQVQQSIPDFTFTKIIASTNPDIKRTNIYDYQPSAMVEKDGTWTVWDCGQEAYGIGRDAIVRTKFNSQGARTSDPTVVMKANSDVAISGDSLHACSPTVVRHAYQYVDLDGPTGNMTQAGDELYVMYYECAPMIYNKCDGSAASTNNGKVTCNPNLTNTSGFTQICTAASTDGINWHKYNDSLFHAPEWLHYGSLTSPPTPVIKIGPEIATNCGFTEDDLKATGKYRIYLQYDACKNDPAGNYGVGQPTAYEKIYDTGGRQIWLWYVDTRGSWNNRKVMLAKSWDGFHFDTFIETDLKYSAEIRYYPGTFAGHTGVFIGVSSFGDNYFMYSDDGIHWIQPKYEDFWWWGVNILKMSDADARTYAAQQIAAYAMGSARSNTTGPNNMCLSPGSSGILADPYGIINTTNGLTIFSNEGFYGVSDNCSATNGCTCYNAKEDAGRGSTWGIYLMKGSFVAHITPTMTPPPPTPTSLLPTSTPIPKAGDANGDLFVNGLDYVIWLTHFGQSVLSSSNGDFNNSGRVDGLDYIVWLNNFGK